MHPVLKNPPKKEKPRDDPKEESENR